MRFVFALLMATASGALLTLMFLGMIPCARATFAYALLLTVYAVDNWWLTHQIEQKRIPPTDTKDDPNYGLINHLLLQNTTLQKKVNDLEIKLFLSTNKKAETGNPQLYRRHVSLD